MKKVKTIVLIVILIAAFNSCQKTDFKEIFMNENEQGLFSISEAKLWLESKHPHGVILKSGDKNKKKYYLTKKWGKAKKFKNDKAEVIEVPLDSDEKLGFITAEAEELARNSGVLEYFLSETRLLIRKNKKTGIITAHFMTIIGDPEYLDKTDFKVDKNTFLKKEKDFSGIILFHNLNGIFNVGWRYTDGKLTHKITKNSVLDSGLRLKEALVEAECYQIQIYETTTYWHYDFGEVVVTCVETVIIDEYVECYYYGEEDGIIGGGGAPSDTDTNTSLIQDCDCETCPICGGCVEVPTLKVAILPDDDGTSKTTTTTNETETPCPMCSCPKIDWDDITKNEKAFCVLQKLIKTGTNEYNSLVLSFISAFSGSEPYHDIVFLVGNLDGAYGNFNSTVYPPVITLNSTTIANRASIEIAKTFMHEVCHAFIYQDAVLTSSSFIANFREYISKNGRTYTKNDHELIYDHYVTPMIKFLKDFDKLSGRTEDDIYYRGLAISGLQNIEGFTQDEKDSIIRSETFLRNRGLNCN